MPEPASTSKSELRKTIRARLQAMTDEQRHASSLAACSRLLSLEAFVHASSVMLYMPLAMEVDVTPVAIRCFQSQRTVCVPRVDWDRRDMEAVSVTSFDDHVMDVDEHGLRSPRGGRLVVPSTIDLVVVPGIAFDAGGRRLGRGGGYYDRFLSRLRRGATTVGIAFDEQIVDKVPVNDEDVSVDVIVTDRRITTTGATRLRR
jgi:5-formyltetrahydrofolate cyclo-ligase